MISVNSNTGVIEITGSVKEVITEYSILRPAITKYLSHAGLNKSEIADLIDLSLSASLAHIEYVPQDGGNK